MANNKGSRTAELCGSAVLPDSDAWLRTQKQQEDRRRDSPRQEQEGLCLDILRIVGVEASSLNVQEGYEDNLQSETETVLDGRNFGPRQCEISIDIELGKRTVRQKSILMPLSCWLFLVFYAHFLAFLDSDTPNQRFSALDKPSRSYSSRTSALNHIIFFSDR